MLGEQARDRESDVAVCPHHCEQHLAVHMQRFAIVKRHGVHRKRQVRYSRDQTCGLTRDVPSKEDVAAVVECRGHPQPAAHEGHHPRHDPAFGKNDRAVAPAAVDSGVAQLPGNVGRKHRKRLEPLVKRASTDWLRVSSIALTLGHLRHASPVWPTVSSRPS